MNALAPGSQAVKCARRLSDSILIAFYQACEIGALDVAADLLKCCEATMVGIDVPGVDRRRHDETLIHAFEHLWFLREAEERKAAGEIRVVAPPAGLRGVRG
jgi:hypothetical protein